MTALLQVENLSVAFGARRVVDDVSFTLAAGQTLALVGESGSGKSVTALSLLGLLPSGGHNPTGRILLDGEAVIGAKPATLQRLRGGVAGMVFQEPMSSLNPLHPIGRQVAEAIRLHRDLARPALRAAVLAALERAGFADAASRLDAYPHQLSGGQRQRVVIAMALANHPKLLIADEPTTALDVTIQNRILDLLAGLRAASGMAMLLITHDLRIVRRYADAVCVMRAGRIVEAGTVEAVFAAPAHPYTRALLGAVPHGAPRPVRQDAATLVEVAGLSVDFSAKAGLLRRTVARLRAVDDVSFSLRAGETLGLVGESGSGKSTIGFATLGLLPATGRVAFAGTALAGLDKQSMRALRARMQIVFQDPFSSLSPRLSVAEIVAEGLRVHEAQLRPAAREARVRAALAEVGLPEDAAGRYPHEFSGGQRQRIAIARAIVLKPDFLVLDEPTSALDMTVQAQIVALLRRLQQEHDLAYLFISHDLGVVRALAHRLIVLRAGRLVEEGAAEAIFAAPQHAYTRELIAASGALDRQTS
ncbi:MAG: ABC transporter ATP-binding protein [Rhodospirillales bacterium]|nr:ABC transporter ATP-binding protein [Rhodospirillales bacterium]